MIAGLLHTVPALAATFDALVADAVPGVQREHIVDAWMLETAIAEGVTPAVQARVASHLRHLQDAGADAVLVTCSSIGEAAERASVSLARERWLRAGRRQRLQRLHAEKRHVERAGGAFGLGLRLEVLAALDLGLGLRFDRDGAVAR